MGFGFRPPPSASDGRSGPSALVRGLGFGLGSGCPPPAIASSHPRSRLSTLSGAASASVHVCPDFGGSERPVRACPCFMAGHCPRPSASDSDGRTSLSGGFGPVASALSYAPSSVRARPRFWRVIAYARMCPIRTDRAARMRLSGPVRRRPHRPGPTGSPRIRTHAPRVRAPPCATAQARRQPPARGLSPYCLRFPVPIRRAADRARTAPRIPAL